MLSMIYTKILYLELLSCVERYRIIWSQTLIDWLIYDCRNIFKHYISNVYSTKSVMMIKSRNWKSRVL